MVPNSEVPIDTFPNTNATVATSDECAKIGFFNSSL